MRHSSLFHYTGKKPDIESELQPVIDYPEIIMYNRSVSIFLRQPVLMVCSGGLAINLIYFGGYKWIYKQ